VTDRLDADLCANCGNQFPDGQVCDKCRTKDYAAEELTMREAAAEFLDRCSMEPTPDAISQLVEVFVPCLRIMTTRPWDPMGRTWRKSGIFGAFTDAKKKWERFWERGWIHGQRHDDSGHDLINYVGFVMRSDPDSGWGEWGEPGRPQ
jgi:hypothetical protein